MSQEPNLQFKLARNALERLFLGNINFRYIDEVHFQILTSGAWQLEGLVECLKYLSDETGPEKNIDPYKQADGTAWVIVSQVLSMTGLKSLALQVAQVYLDLCYSIQLSTKKRLHKGAPLFWTSERSYEIGDTQAAAGFMILAFVEDVILRDYPKGIPSYNRLAGLYGFSHTYLANLTDYIVTVKHSRDDEWFPFFPEEILIGWEQLRLPPIPKPLQEGDK